MTGKNSYRPEHLHYLKMLARQYPTVQAASTEIINLRAILNLPKGTEHFLSDIHGEYEAFLHIMNSSSGEVKEKLTDLFGDTLTQRAGGAFHTGAAAELGVAGGVGTLGAESLDVIHAYAKAAEV